MIVGNTSAVSSFAGATGGAIQAVSLASSGANYLAQIYSDAAGGISSLEISRSRGTTIGTQTIVQSGDVIGRVVYTASDGANFIRAAQIQSEVDGTPGTNDMPGRLVFSTTADGASSPTERMRIDSAGNVGIGATPSAGQGVIVNKVVTGNADSVQVTARGAFQSDVTSSGIYYRTVGSTQATAFTLGEMTHFSAQQTTLGAGSTVTNQIGFNAASSLTGATNNYGFYGNIASGTNRFNLYMNGTAGNYMAGSLGIGTTTLTQFGLRVSKTITGNVASYGVRSDGVVQSDVTTQAFLYNATGSTAASAFTLSQLRYFSADQGTIGATSAVTSQYGFIASPSLTGATNNYGFYGDIASGTGRWNFYAAGTAANYFAGDMQLDKTVTAGGTTGAQTINKNAGTVNFAAAASSLVVTDSRVTTSSIIICTVGTNDTTLKSVAAVAGAGSFTLHASAAATAETRVNFLIIN